MNKFSIILPVKNGGDYLKECVNSILAQTHTDFNLLVLENASTDDSLNWLQQQNDSRIKIIASDISLSMVDNWSRIKDLDKNEFMTIIGHDDLLHPYYLEEMNRLIDIHPQASLYQSHFNFINETGVFLSKCQIMDEYQTADNFLKCHILHTLDSMGKGYMFRSKDYDNLGGMPVNYPNLMFADYQLWIQLTSINYKATTEKVCFSYRLNNSVSRKTNGELYQQAFESYVYFLVEEAKNDNKIKLVLDNYGKVLLMYYCESLCHRILKTNVYVRKLKVKDHIDKCIEYAKLLIPDQAFSPRKNFRIKIAEMFDSNFITRKIFYFFKKKYL